MISCKKQIKNTKTCKNAWKINRLLLIRKLRICRISFKMKKKRISLIVMSKRKGIQKIKEILLTNTKKNSKIIKIRLIMREKLPSKDMIKRDMSFSKDTIKRDKSLVHVMKRNWNHQERDSKEKNKRMMIGINWMLIASINKLRIFKSKTTMMLRN